jgi:hypothetical protein
MHASGRMPSSACLSADELDEAWHAARPNEPDGRPVSQRRYLPIKPRDGRA